MTIHNKQIKAGTSKKPMSRKKKITIALMVAVLLLIVLLSVLLFGRNKKAPDPSKMTKKDAVKYLASKDFSSLPMKEQRSYFDRMREKGERPPMFDKTLSEEERRAIHRNLGKIMRQEMEDRANKFLKMSKEEQDEYIKKMVDEMEARRKKDQAEGRGPEGPGGPPGGNGTAGGNGSRGPGGPDPSRMQSMMENTSSSSRAAMNEMHKRMHQEMEKRRTSK